MLLLEGNDMWVNLKTSELLVDLKEGTASQLKFAESFINRAQRSGVQYNAFVES